MLVKCVGKSFKCYQKPEIFNFARPSRLGTGLGNVKSLEHLRLSPVQYQGSDHVFQLSTINSFLMARLSCSVAEDVTPPWCVRCTYCSWAAGWRGRPAGPALPAWPARPHLAPCTGPAPPSGSCCNGISKTDVTLLMHHWLYMQGEILLKGLPVVIWLSIFAPSFQVL